VALALEPRSVRQPSEVPPVRYVEAAERLLQALRDRVLADPLEPFAALETGQLGHLLHAPHVRQPQLPCDATLLERGVPHRTTAARDPRRLSLLLAGEPQAVPTTRDDRVMRPAPRYGAHCVYLLHIHLVFCVKYRCKALTAPTLARLQDGSDRMLDALSCELIEFSGERDHVHFLIAHPPHMPVSELARRLKGRSAYVLRREFPELRRVCRGHLWSPSYFAASVGGAPLDVLKRYIDSQDRPA